MRVQRRQQDGSIAFDLLDDHDRPIAEVVGFLRHLAARACSPNTLCAYAHDLLHFYQFLELTGLSVDRFGPPESLTFAGALAPGAQSSADRPARPCPGHDHCQWRLS